MGVILIGGMMREEHEAKQKEKDYKSKTVAGRQGGTDVTGQ